MPDLGLSPTALMTVIKHKTAKDVLFMKIKAILIHLLLSASVVFLFCGHCDVTPQVHISSDATSPLLSHTKITHFIANALDLRLSCTNLSTWSTMQSLIAGKCRRKHLQLHSQHCHYNDVIMSAMASEITGVSIVYSTVCSGADQRKYQRSASLAFMRGIHRWPGNSPHNGPVTRNIFPFDDVIMCSLMAQMLERWCTSSYLY